MHKKNRAHLIKYCLVILLIKLPLNYQSTLTKSAVYHELSAGHFGHEVWALAKAKWISYKYKIPFLYKPFFASGNLQLHHKELKYSTHAKNYKKIVYIKDENHQQINPEANILYRVNLFTKLNNWTPLGQTPEEWFSFTEPTFEKLLREALTPTKNYVFDKIPDDHISVAVHVRKGLKNDRPLFSESHSYHYSHNKRPTHIKGKYLDIDAPYKVPPDAYYIEQIETISELFNTSKIYVHIFTDYNNPKKLLEKYKKAINKENIIIDSDMNINHTSKNKNVVRDLAVMSKFDIFIRSGSSYSLLADFIGNFSLSIFPKKIYWKNGTCHVPKIGIHYKINQLLDHKTLKNKLVELKKENVYEIKSIGPMS